jgi:hypothetical protein
VPRQRIRPNYVEHRENADGLRKEGAYWLSSSGGSMMASPRWKSYSYSEITKIAADQITSYMHAARRSTGTESQARRETAYGVYMGWRALVGSYPDQSVYRSDDARLEALLSA